MKNPDIAIAIKYKSEIDKAPKIVAKGKGIVAANIIKRAKGSDIFINEDKNLANKLYNIELGSEIPIELYEAVASILAFVYEIDKEKCI